MKLFWQVVAAGIISIFAGSVGAVSIVGEVNTQKTDSSCQSYAFAVMLALIDESYGGTARALQSTENTIRALVMKHGGTSGNHDAWDKAIDEFTNSKYQLKREYPKDYVSWVARVRELTTPSIADVMNLTFEKAIATSVTYVDGSKYAKGHVITVIGIGPEVANTSILYLNGGIKPEGDSEFSDHICRNDSLGSDKYIVGIRNSSNYELKGNGIYWIE
ncbi:MAG: hypothetical protein AAF483_13820 [Planctomycetota bacterium]